MSANKTAYYYVGLYSLATINNNIIKNLYRGL
jgi:hypothetical protein